MSKIISIILLVLAFSCNDSNDSDSPYSELLHQSPYAAITDSIKQLPDNDELYFRRAVLLNRNNFPEPALADFRKAWLLSPSEKYAFGVTNSLLEKRPDSAIVFIDEAMKSFPKSYLLLLTKARALDALGRTDEAISVSDELVALSPDLPEVYLLRWELFRKKNNLPASTAALERAYWLAPDLSKAFDLAFGYAENKDPRTIAFCDSLIRVDSMGLHAEPLFVKGIYYSNVNEKERALRIFDETIRKDYNFLDAYIEKGRILLDQKKAAAALASFELANTIRPSFPDAWYWMGKAQEALGHPEEAKLNYQKAYGLDKTFVEAKEALQ